MNVRYIEALETQLQILEDTYETYLAERDDDTTRPLACAACFELCENCKCFDKVIWPIEYVITKLAWYIRRTITDESA